MLEIRDLRVAYGAIEALHGISLEAGEGEIVALIGSNGAGKSTLLNTISGLMRPTDGTILYQGKPLEKTPPYEIVSMGVCQVPEGRRIFASMTVLENLELGAYLAQNRANFQENLARTYALFPRLKEREKQEAGTLSGGEQQKVALARALSIKPQVLLLDEPLSALDPETREGVQRELRQLHSQLKVTAIHVTHDFEEAIALGNRIAVLGEGHIKQIGTPEEVFHQPNSEFVARFAMTRNIFTGEVVDKANGDIAFRTEDIELATVTNIRGKAHASIRPEDILISPESFISSARNRFAGTITHIADRGSVLYITVNLPPDFVCLITRRSFDEMKLTEGQTVYITFKASAIHVF